MPTCLCPGAAATSSGPATTSRSSVPGRAWLPGNKSRSFSRIQIQVFKFQVLIRIFRQYGSKFSLNTQIRVTSRSLYDQLFSISNDYISIISIFNNLINQILIKKKFTLISSGRCLFLCVESGLELRFLTEIILDLDQTLEEKKL